MCMRQLKEVVRGKLKAAHELCWVQACIISASGTSLPTHASTRTRAGSLGRVSAGCLWLHAESEKQNSTKPEKPEEPLRLLQSDERTAIPQRIPLQGEVYLLQLHLASPRSSRPRLAPSASFAMTWLAWAGTELQLRAEQSRPGAGCGFPQPGTSEAAGAAPAPVPIRSRGSREGKTLG